ncbi:hypothetical protein QLX67_05660 [Balneolaceae bacterium ANBcel3]|nr:hypothetical protein [Balneolaceae bacterium ANBcel3]
MSICNILLHDDWEIYGDGTGDPEDLMFEPARRILDICDQYGAKYTFYAEIGQQLHMLNAPGRKWQQYANTWEEVLKDAIKRGHDVQLHFHPQWIGAELKNGEWKLDYTKWHSGHVETELLDEWIGKGKQYLENLLQPLNESYRVVIYRAGGWLCQPSNGLYNALRNNGIVCDVSVMKGRYAKYADGSYLDFRDAVSRYEPWEVDPDNFAYEKKGSGVWELPVFTETSALPHSAYLLKKAFRPLHYYRIHHKRKVQKGRGVYSPKIVKKAKYKEYYGSFGYMHFQHLLSYVDKVRDYHQSKQTSLEAHLTFLTHSKSFLDYDNFEQLLIHCTSDNKLHFSTTRAYVNKNL